MILITILPLFCTLAYNLYLTNNITAFSKLFTGVNTIVVRIKSKLNSQHDSKKKEKFSDTFFFFCFTFLRLSQLYQLLTWHLS